eukprot:5793052-Prymnesium_polylepis.2
MEAAQIELKRIAEEKKAASERAAQEERALREVQPVNGAARVVVAAKGSRIPAHRRSTLMPQRRLSYASVGLPPAPQHDGEVQPSRTGLQTLPEAAAPSDFAPPKRAAPQPAVDATAAHPPPPPPPPPCDEAASELISSSPLVADARASRATSGAASRPASGSTPSLRMPTPLSPPKSVRRRLLLPSRGSAAVRR